MTRYLVAAAALASLLGGVAAEASSGATPVAESFSRPLTAWTKQGKVKAKRTLLRNESILRISAGRKRGGWLIRKLPVRRFALSADLALAPASRVSIGFGSTPRRLRLRRSAHGTRTFVAGRRPVAVRPVFNPSGRKWVHLQVYASGSRVRGSVGRHRFTLKARPNAKLTIVLPTGTVLIDDLLVTPLSDAGLLPLHRLADLQGRVPRGRFVLGANDADQLKRRDRYWTRGFLAGALWNASSMTPESDLFARWALERSADVLGYETADSHDVGMIYQNGALASLPTACGTGALSDIKLCARARASAVIAANQLLALADTNAAAGTIPTRRVVPPADADTIIDSAMNVPLLYWATRETGDPRFREVARRHIRRLAETHVRPDGSTVQSVHNDPQTGQIKYSHTHQGVVPTSVWARGQGWAVHGFATSADELRDPKVLAVAERTAGWVRDNLPPSGLPLYDYHAPPGAPSDTSASAITAAGLLRLASLCERWTGACTHTPDHWRVLGQRVLSGALTRVSRSVPLGFFGGQVGTLGDRLLWDDGSAELIYGLSYGLEAVAAARPAP